MEIKLTVDLSDRTYELGQQLLEAVKGGATKIDSTMMGQSHRHLDAVKEVKVEKFKQKEVQEELPFAETEIVEAEAKPKRATRAAKEGPKEEVVNELKAKKVEEPKEETSDKDALQDMRALLRTKINDGNNREEIRHKLVSLGANNLTTLAPKHYDEMITFLQGL